jgi:hypothetical protein
MRYEHDGASQRALVGLFGSHHQPELRAELEVSGAADLRRVRERLNAALDRLADTMTARPRSATVTIRVVEAIPRGFASSRSATIGRSGVEPRRGEDRMREGAVGAGVRGALRHAGARLRRGRVPVPAVPAIGRGLGGHGRGCLADRRGQAAAGGCRLNRDGDGPGDAANPGPGGPMRRRLPQRPAGGRA